MIMTDEKENIISKLVDPPSKIDKFLPSEVIVCPPANSSISTNADDDDLEKDFKKAQKSIQDTMDLANEAIVDLSEMAKNSNHPRVYEVLNALLRTVAQNARDLIEVHKRVKEIKLASEPQQNITNNNLILTTAEMIETIKKNRES